MFNNRVYSYSVYNNIILRLLLCSIRVNSGIYIYVCTVPRAIIKRCAILLFARDSIKSKGDRRRKYTRRPGL